MSTENDLEVAKALGRIEQKVDDVGAKLSSVVTQTTLTNGRVSILEAWRNQLKGGTIALSAAIAASTTIIGWLILIYLKNH